MTLSPPELLKAEQVVSDFACGVAELDDWLRKRALGNNQTGASRTFVVLEAKSVVGYYALSACAIAVASAPGRFRRNMPDPIPVALLGRLAIASSHRGRGLGRALFRDAAKRVIAAADALGIRGLIVHAISAEARAFYLALGFYPSPLEPMTLMVTLADLQAAF